MDGPCVFIDPNAKSPDEKYKMFIKVSPVRGKPKRNDRGPIPVRVTKQLPKAQYENHVLMFQYSRAFS